MAEIREQVAKECLGFAARDAGTYRLTVPTGGAKTLGSLRYALNHAKLHKKDRALYVDPYLSILEQNGDVFRSAIGKDVILEHHSNIILEEDSKASGESVLDNYKHLTENWDHPVIITNFVQFLNTLFSDGTSYVRRFHSLENSVIVIDEIQMLPLSCTYLFNMAINFLTKAAGATVLLCFATQPCLHELDKPIQFGTPLEVMSDVGSLYQQLKRVQVTAVKEPLDTGQLCEFSSNLVSRHSDLLLIVNTKQAAKVMYEELASKYRQEEIEIVHLSANMCASHRLDIINRMKQELEDKNRKKKLVCISTSLIEAGVDLSFSCVIRSYAGLDSVAQAAGRCNRGGEISVRFLL